MKRVFTSIFALLLTLAMVAGLLPTAVLAEEPTLDAMVVTVASVKGKPEDTVEVAVSLSNNPGIASLVLDVDYDDTVLTLTDVVFDEAFGAYVTTPEPYENPQRISFMSPMEEVDADGRYDMLLAFARLDASEVSFLKKEVLSDGSVKYTVYFNNAASCALQTQIVALLNSNTADGVIPVENYFDSENFEIDGEYTLVIKEGKIVSCDVDIEMNYTPTGGEYTDRVVTLNNRIEIEINHDYEDAAEYTAPKAVTTKLLSLGLVNFKYDIL